MDFIDSWLVNVIRAALTVRLCGQIFGQRWLFSPRLWEDILSEQTLAQPLSQKSPFCNPAVKSVCWYPSQKNDWVKASPGVRRVQYSRWLEGGGAGPRSGGERGEVRVGQRRRRGRTLMDECLGCRRRGQQFHQGLALCPICPALTGHMRNNKSAPAPPNEVFSISISIKTVAACDCLFHYRLLLSQIGTDLPFVCTGSSNPPLVLFTNIASNTNLLPDVRSLIFLFPNSPLCSYTAAATVTDYRSVREEQGCYHKYVWCSLSYSSPAPYETLFREYLQRSPKPSEDHSLSLPSHKIWF